MKNILLLTSVGIAFYGMVGLGDEATFSQYINGPETVNAAGPGPKAADLSPPAAEKHKAKDEDKGQEGLSAAPVVLPAAWKACTVDHDCAAAVVDCTSWIGINQKYLPRIRKNLRSCSEAVDPGFQPQAACREQKCVTTDKATDTSWAEWLDQMRHERDKP